MVKVVKAGHTITKLFPSSVTLRKLVEENMKFQLRGAETEGGAFPLNSQDKRGNNSNSSLIKTRGAFKKGRLAFHSLVGYKLRQKICLSVLVSAWAEWKELETREKWMAEKRRRGQKQSILHSHLSWKGWVNSPWIK